MDASKTVTLIFTPFLAFGRLIKRAVRPFLIVFFYMPRELKRGNFDKVIELYQHLSATEPSFVIATYPSVVEAYIYQKDYEKAFQLLKKLIIKYSNHSPVWRLFGFAYCESGEFEKGMYYYLRAIALSPHNRILRLELVRYLFNRGLYEETIQEIQWLIKKGIRTSEIYIMLCFALLNMQKEELLLKSQEDLKRIIKREGKKVKPQTIYNFAWLLEKQNKFQEALEILNHYLTYNPTDTTTRALKATIESKYNVQTDNP